MYGGYLIGLSASPPNTELIVAIFNTAGIGRCLYGAYGDNLTKALWVVPTGNAGLEEVADKLRAVPAIKDVFVTTLSHPVTVTEVAAARQIFANIGLDTTDVDDKILYGHLTAEIERRYCYYMDVNHELTSHGLNKVQLKPLQEHPDFLPGWLQHSYPIIEKPEGRAFSVDDFEIETITETIETEDPEPSSPMT